MASSIGKAITIIEATDECLRFVLSNTDTSIANALRRVMIAEVPTVAIGTVMFSENSSALPEEFIAHRLGLIPIRCKNGVPSKKLQNPCSCEGGCSKCRVTFDLDVKCTTAEPIDVISTDLITTSDDFEPAHFSSEKEREVIAGRGIRIMSLAKGQRIHCRCIAQLGVGKVHAKWSPVGTVSMKYTPIVRISKELMDKKDFQYKREFVDTCPKKVFELDPRSQVVTVRDEHDCMFCGDCELFNRDYSEKVVTISQVNNRFEFAVESVGNMPPLLILKEAISVLINKLNDVRSSIDKLGSKSTL